jgi:site-specific recombinase XerD
MVSEQIFKISAIVGKLKGSPLEKFAEGFCCWLLDRGFKRHTISSHFFRLARFSKYLDSNNANIHNGISIKGVKIYFEGHSRQCRKTGSSDTDIRRAGYSINRFIQYLYESGHSDLLQEQDIYQPVLDAYINWMRHHQHASDGTLGVRVHSIKRFLQWLGPEATPADISKLTADRVEEFFLSYAKEMGRAARRSMQSTLRTFLRFCLQKGYIDRPLDMAVPTLRTYKLATLPAGLNETEAQQILRGVNRNNQVGRRDYAILQILYVYGVRGGQVRALRFEDIDWEHNLILFKALKHGKDIQLPLTAEVGESLLDYLQNSRPESSFPHVFLTSRAPYHPLPHSSSLSAIIDRHIRAAGVDCSRRGAHVFRHGFATRMLKKGHSLKEIADVLGHRHLGTTFIYTKVDLHALEQVALDWPKEVPPCDH